MEDAVVGIYRLQETTGERVSTSELAAELDVEPPSVSSIFSRLTDRGLIDREPHRPVALTESGREVALRLVRNHRLLETFLVECLGYGWGEVHDECDRLEHHVSRRFTTSLESFLSNPKADPHGDPIPDANLDVPTEREMVHLDTVDEDTTVTIQRILAGDRETLEYLASRGLEPGDTITVEERTPIGLLVVSTATGQPRLPTETARQIICSSK
ncbi:transcription repressor [Haloferax mucosum ATCC BAA-1512]|uniref:Manganese transport regulator n=2 Tax=Haloferax mucosum TaxID=403181 RepID=M0IGT8_9EURY|nr:transcription repressor [Haloferax mucosum ATCC BAA-1512]